MAEHPNATVLRRAYEAFEKGDMQALAGLFADDVVWHMPGNTPFSGEHKGRDAVFAGFVKATELSAGTFKIELHDIVANDEHAVSINRATASRGGKNLGLLGADVFHVRDGKIAEMWSFSENQRIDDEFWS